MWLKRYKTLKPCLTDNGKQFTFPNFATLLAKYSIKHITSASYNPTGNAIVERANKEIGIVLILCRKMKISELCKSIWVIFYCTSNKTLRSSPFEIFSQKSIFKNTKLKNKVNYESIKNKLQDYCNKYNFKLMKNKYQIKYQVHDLVFIKNHDSDKIYSQWIGPFRICHVSKSGNNVFRE
ncbi:Gag-Pro-Pol polyprotein [Dictyocoela muelleri]|nr:Gag-Pro-Pol polyprotein [Dictyocoela muelleri]